MIGELAKKEKEESLRLALEMDLNTIGMLAYSIVTDLEANINHKKTAHAIIRLVKEVKSKVMA
jgi:hypothetical protein